MGTRLQHDRALNPNSDVRTRPRTRRRPSSSMRRRFLQRKEPIVPRLFCSVILIVGHLDLRGRGRRRARGGVPNFGI